MTRGEKRIFLLIAILIIGLFLVGLAVRHMFRDFAGSPCSISSLVELQSPDHAYKIVLFNNDCMAGIESSVPISLLRSDQVFSPYTQPGIGITTLARVHVNQVSVRWITPKEVLITFPQSGAVQVTPPVFVKMEISDIDFQIQEIRE